MSVIEPIQCGLTAKEQHMPVKIIRKITCDADGEGGIILSDGEDGQLLVDVRDECTVACLYLNRETWEVFKSLGDAIFAEMEAKKKP